MRGWLAVPILKRNSQFLGVLQVSDKYEGEFSEKDENILKQYAEIAAGFLSEIQSAVIEDSVEIEYTNRRKIG
jgi:signal transduction protein with GAF and PtsI domain